MYKKEAILILTLIISSGVVFANLSVQRYHNSLNIGINIDDTPTNLKDAIDNGYIRDNAGLLRQELEEKINSGHSLSEIFVSVDGDEMTLKQALDNNNLCGTIESHYTSFINFGHSADEIEVSDGVSLQDAINSGEFCCTPDCTNKACGDDGCGGSCEKDIDYLSSTKTGCDCEAAGGEYVDISGDGSGTSVCRFNAASNANAVCASGWTQAAQWSTTEGCSSSDSNWYGNDANHNVYCGIANPTISGGCVNTACSNGNHPYSISGHSWANQASSYLKDGPKGGGCDCGYSTLRWNGVMYEQVQGYSTPDCMTCAGGVGYRWIIARTTQIGCY